jgi:hypothetical protein
MAGPTFLEALLCYLEAAVRWVAHSRFGNRARAAVVAIHRRVTVQHPWAPRQATPPPWELRPSNRSKLRSSKLRSSKLRSSKLRSSKLRSSKLRSSKLRSSKLRSSKLRLNRHNSYSGEISCASGSIG